MMGSVSSVIVCQDHGRSLEAAVASLHRQTNGPSELVVVDAGTGDLNTAGALERLRAAGIRMVTAHGPLAAAYREGVRAATGDYLLFAGAAVTVAPTYVAAATACLDEDDSLDFVCPAPSGVMPCTGGDPWPFSWEDALAHGSVPSGAPMLRRRLWDVTGCDDALGPIALVDFWISALSRGARGRMLAPALLDGPPPSADGEIRSWRNGFEHFAALYDKHRDLVARSGDELLRRKDEYLARQEERHSALAAQEAALARELSAITPEIDELTRSLAGHGLSRVEWGDLRRVTPVSPVWGSDRGRVVNRHYIERFLDDHRADIRGGVLEVKDSSYTERFGAGVTRSEVLDIDPSNARATIVADLMHADDVPSDSFDCIILTQVLNLVRDPGAAVLHAMRILRPGGVLLCTVAALDRVSYEDRGVDGDYWRFTEASVAALLARACPVNAFSVTTYGNVLACCAFLYGLSADELSADELDAHDPSFPLIVAARAVKPPAGWSARRG